MCSSVAIRRPILVYITGVGWIERLCAHGLDMTNIITKQEKCLEIGMIQKRRSSRSFMPRTKKLSN